MSEENIKTDTERRQARRAGEEYVDLHTHSTASDGSHAPGEVVRLADEAGLAVVALTDHDTVEGLAPAAEAAVKCPKLHFVPGVELSARFPTGTMHVLGLGINSHSPRMLEVTRWLKDARNRRNPLILENLARLGMPVTMDEVLSAAGADNPASTSRIISRIHIAEAMRRKGYVSDVDEAFGKYISPSGPAWVDKDRLSPQETISVIHDAGGLAVLAHPVQLNCRTPGNLRNIVAQLVSWGMDGIEVWHPDHDGAQSEFYRSVAEEFDLCTLGGSDFHGPVKPKARLGVPPVTMEQIKGRLTEHLFA